MTVPSTALALGAKLERAGAITETSLDLPADTTIQKWASLGAMWGRVGRSLSWWIGDWANFGEDVYGEEHAQYIESTGLAPETLRQYQRICRQIPPERRHPNLSMSVHRLVADLEPAEQVRWLDACEANQWGRQALALALGKQPAGKLGVGDGSVGNGGDQLDEVARAILRDAAEYDDLSMLVPVEDIARLRAIYGEEP